MGIIQQAINQAAGTIGIAARLSPTLETKQKEYAAKQEYKAFEKLASSEFGNENYLEEKTERLEDIAKIRPTQKNIEAALKSGEELGKERAAIRRQQANQKAADIQEEQLQQKQNFLDFIGFVTDPGEVEKAFKEIKKDGK